jgi:hypothetical protein
VYSAQAQYTWHRESSARLVCRGKLAHPHSFHYFRATFTLFLFTSLFAVQYLNLFTLKLLEVDITRNKLIITRSMLIESVYHYQHLAVKDVGHLLTRSGLGRQEVSLKLVSSRFLNQRDLLFVNSLVSLSFCVLSTC